MRVATTLLVGGALAWLLKLVVIAMAESTDGAIASILWVIGFFGMLAGAALLGAWLARGRHLVVRIGAALLGAVTFFVSMNALDSLMKSLTGSAGPGYLEEEWGIFAAAVVWLAVGLAAGARARSRSSEGQQVAT